MTENLEYVQRGFRILHLATAKYLAQEMNKEYGDEWRSQALNSLDMQTQDLTSSDGDLFDSLDVANCLRLIDRQWGVLFRKRLTRNRRS